MRDELLGYLLNALEKTDCERLEAHLTRDPALRRDLDVLKRGLQPLAHDGQPFEPPARLASRTCEFVRHRAALLCEAPAGQAQRWRTQDLSVAAGIVIAAGMLFFPAVNHSRLVSQMAGCQFQLQMIGNALLNYSERHCGYFPDVPVRDRLALVSMFAPRMLELGYLECPKTLVCPASMSDNEFLKLPTCQEFERATREQLAQLSERLSGSYSYCLGYYENQELRSPRNLHRSTFPVLADSPRRQRADLPAATLLASGAAPLSHGGHGVNVWYEDGHVDLLPSCLTCDRGDNIFVNRRGQFAPGVDANDVVLGYGAVDLQDAMGR
ncbi:MAG: hypothetical protein K1X74_07765 [Pirellulales bacterium]|nr:hypothetical protein [Pirellulales bacterium]